MQLLFLLTVEHQSQHITCFMINLTLKHIYKRNNLYSIFNFVTNFGFTSQKIGKIGGFSLKIGENRNRLKKLEKIGKK